MAAAGTLTLWVLAHRQLHVSLAWRRECLQAGHRLERACLTCCQAGGRKEKRKAQVLLPMAGRQAARSGTAWH